MSQKHLPRHRRDQQVTAKPSLPDLEVETLKYWQDQDVFQKSIDQRPAGKKGSNEFVFYDGPPFANGLPHYGHLLTGYVKDAVGRYQTMLGHRVERRFGWDTHGLPAELEAERELGIEDKSEIEGPGGMGIEAFNAACRRSVLKYTGEWENYVNRQARWVDFADDYKTLDPEYMESVLWAFRTLYDKGLIYEGYKVLPYCWNDETPLSNHELRMDDDVYQERTDQTVTVGVALVDEAGRPTGERALLWTTTPWTLPSNLAVAVGPEIDYVEVVPSTGDLAGERVILAEARLADYAAELGEDPAVARRLRGTDLVGRRYQPIFPYFAGKDPNAFQILGADFVTTEDGSGLVHLAPAFGEDDMAVCLAAGIKTVVPVDEAGKFTAEVPDYEGVQVFDSNRLVIADLREGTGALSEVADDRRAVLVKQASYAHSYPHCWRCRQPLIYKAVSSWFVEVTRFRDRMVELNQEINWVPNHIKDGQFGHWLAGARDWSISRNRFWGAPIPVWKSDDPRYPRVDVYGSYEQLAADFGVSADSIDLHRPYVDELVRPNPDDPTGKSMMRRVPEVLDCWFESGAMPFAQVHYPFENREWFEDHYPGDFIVEYIGQTRGWFYLLHVLATALFDRPAFYNAVSHGIVLGDDGRKMSKSLRNYPDVNGVFDTYGSDAMRWFLLSSTVVRGGNLIVTEGGIRDAVRQILLPLWNTYYFLALYANVCHGGEGIDLRRLGADDPVAELPEMERYLLARTHEVVLQMRASLDAYDIPSAAQTFRDHLDVVTNWYVRTQRQRFWDEEQDSFDTLYTVLVTLTEAVAPLLPLLAEEIWRGLTGGESVHLVDFPTPPAQWADPELVETMDSVREVVSAAHSLRKANRIRVRQPLAAMAVVAANADQLARFAPLIGSEVNVKEVRVEDPTHSGFEVRQELALNPRAFDPQLRPLTSKLFAAQKQGQWQAEADGSVTFPGVEFQGEPVRLSGDQVTLSTRVVAGGDEVATVLDSGCFVVLDTAISEELAAEGYARDVIRAVQDARKNADLHIADRINLHLGVPAEFLAAARTHAELIAAETLATTVDLQESPAAELVIDLSVVKD